MEIIAKMTVVNGGNECIVTAEVEQNFLLKVRLGRWEGGTEVIEVQFMREDVRSNAVVRHLERKSKTLRFITVLL